MGALQDVFRVLGGPSLPRQFPQELVLIHAVLEGFAAVDENYGDFVVKLAPQLVVGVNVDLLPGKTSPAVQLRESFLHDLAKMASLARVQTNLAGLGHAASVPTVHSQFPLLGEQSQAPSHGTILGCRRSLNGR